MRKVTQGTNTPHSRGDSDSLSETTSSSSRPSPAPPSPSYREQTFLPFIIIRHPIDNVQNRILPPQEGSPDQLMKAWVDQQC
jgi:hypothetical protein